ncbi:MAG TPA: HD domain-containing phosphohydrolase [Actinomycetes bacterium]|jgi:HD-GYP domain-containing protein (c-di-GMP phosphodiesterase class II)|nr:HD domain-containing phosphohydrolase [Actinomycetes bacterium]
MDVATCHLNQLDAAQQQLLVFAHELSQLYRTERSRTAELERALRLLEDSYLNMVKTLAFVVEVKDPSTHSHLERTHEYATVLARLVDAGLADDRGLRYGFLLHDVGKIGVPEAILHKPGPLDEEEWGIMRAHPEIGVQMVAGIKSFGGAVEVIRSHHERWDGRGYPSGLRGERIPLSARIFSVCDAFDAMTSDRPYRRALPFGQAVEEVIAGAGGQFDPVIVEAFVSIENLEEIHASLHAGAGLAGVGAAPSTRATLGADAGTG